MNDINFLNYKSLPNAKHIIDLKSIINSIYDFGYCQFIIGTKSITDDQINSFLYKMFDLMGNGRSRYDTDELLSEFVIMYDLSQQHIFKMLNLMQVSHYRLHDTMLSLSEKKLSYDNLVKFWGISDYFEKVSLVKNITLDDKSLIFIASEAIECKFDGGLLTDHLMNNKSLTDKQKGILNLL